MFDSIVYRNRLASRDEICIVNHTYDAISVSKSLLKSNLAMAKLIQRLLKSIILTPIPRHTYWYVIKNSMHSSDKTPICITLYKQQNSYTYFLLPLY